MIDNEIKLKVVEIVNDIEQEIDILSKLIYNLNDNFLIDDSPIEQENIEQIISSLREVKISLNKKV